MASEAISIDRFIYVEAERQFDFIYSNYSVMKQILSDYRSNLITEVIDQKANNRRSDSEELGIRIQTSRGTSSPTENLAINEIMIGKAIDDGFLDDDFFKDTDDKQDLINKVNAYHTVSRGWNVFTSKLKTMSPRDQAILGAHIMQKKTMVELAEELGVDYRSVVQRIWRIKKKLIAKVTPNLTMR